MRSSRALPQRDIYIALNLHDASRTQLTIATIDFGIKNLRLLLRHPFRITDIRLSEWPNILYSAQWSIQIPFPDVSTYHTSVIINYLSTLSNSGTLYDSIIQDNRSGVPRSWTICAQVRFSPDGSPGAAWDDRPVALIEIAKTVNPFSLEGRIHNWLWC